MSRHSHRPGQSCSAWIPLSFRPFRDSQLDKNTSPTPGLSLPSTWLCSDPSPHSWSRNRGKSIFDPSFPSTSRENMWRKGQDSDKLTCTFMTLREGIETRHQLVALEPGLVGQRLSHCEKPQPPGHWTWPSDTWVFTPYLCENHRSRAGWDLRMMLASFIKAMLSGAGNGMAS